MAQMLFVGNGYNAMSVDKICKMAKVNKGSFYHFFPTKRDLLIAVIEKNWLDMQGFLFHPAFRTELQPMDRIKHFFELLYTNGQSAKKMFGHAVACPIGMFGAELDDPVVRKKVDEIFSLFADFFEKTLREARDLGEIDHQIDISNTAQILNAYIQGVLLTTKIKDDLEVIKQLTEGALRLIPKN